MATTTVTIRLDDEEKQYIADYAKTFGMTVSEFIRSTVLERIEDELDLKLWEEAKAEYDANPVTYSADEIARKYL